MGERRRTVGVVSVGRSDYGILQPVLARIADTPSLDLLVYAGGMHLSQCHGLTVSMIEADGYHIAARVDFSLDKREDSAAVAESIGRGVTGFAQAFSATRPDILVLLGDRYEMHAAALAALPMGIPMAHIHGGEVTEGAMDEALRHGITKISHLHFPSTAEHARRICQLGEEPWRVIVSGAPALDHLDGFIPLPRETLHSRFGVPAAEPFLLATFHPVTLASARTRDDVASMLAAITECGLPTVFTLPNADTFGIIIREMLENFVAWDPRHVLIGNFGTHAYFSAMHYAAAMIGNSSSGLVEAPSFRLPVVNIGERQRGRTRASNVLDADPTPRDVTDALRRALHPTFRGSLGGLVNPYGDGQASYRICDGLLSVKLDSRLIVKKFHDQRP